MIIVRKWKRKWWTSVRYEGLLWVKWITQSPVYPPGLVNGFPLFSILIWIRTIDLWLIGFWQIVHVHVVNLLAWVECVSYIILCRMMGKLWFPGKSVLYVLLVYSVEKKAVGEMLVKNFSYLFQDFDL